MRLTIGNKIFAIAAGMALMMAFAAAVSSYFMGNANSEVRHVADTYIPLSKAIEELQDHVQEQEILYAWALPRLLTRDERALLDPVLKKYEQGYRDDHVEYKSSLQLLLQAQQQERFIDFKIELARVNTKER